MAESRMKELAEELLRRSKEDKVAWEESGQKDSYRVFFPDISVSISREGDYGYHLELYGESGRAIGSLDAYREDPMDALRQDPMYPLLGDLFDLAEGCVQQKGIDKALEYLKRS